MSLRQRAPVSTAIATVGKGASTSTNVHGDGLPVAAASDRKRVKGRKASSRDCNGTRLWVYLHFPVLALALFAFVVGCSYVALGGHGHEYHQHYHYHHHVVDQEAGGPRTLNLRRQLQLPLQLQHATRKLTDEDRRHYIGHTLEYSDYDHVDHHDHHQRNQQPVQNQQHKDRYHRQAITNDEHKRQADQLEHDRLASERNRRDQEKEHKVPVPLPAPKLATTTTTTTTSKTIREQLISLDHQRDSEQLRKEKQSLLNQIRTKQTAGLKKVALQNIEQEETEKMNMHPEDKKESIVEAKYEANDWSGSCQKQAKDRMKNTASLEDAIQWMEDLTSCVEKDLTEELVAHNKEISFQARTRFVVAGELENYTCADPHAPGAPDLSSHVWEHSDGNDRVVHIKHDRSSSKIHVIDNFISQEECIAMEKAAAKTLHKATVADGKGGSRLSDHRKAMQAGIRVPWHEEQNGNPIARLSRRVYDYTNYALNLNIDEHGQEDLMSIQYFGRGREDEHPDRYMPHCDGDCSGLPHHNGTRMATMVMYCTVPKVGGSTNFRNSGVHVKPVVGNAIFFSYMDPKTRITDNRFTEHSGCPVYEGDKKIVTQWIRVGVDKENPWDSFNTLGIRMRDAKSYE